MSENFLSRWSKRKLEVRAQEKLAEDAPGQQADLPPAGIISSPDSVLGGAASNKLPAPAPQVQTVPQPEMPLPTEADLLAVENGGDIKAFMVDKVSTELKNKAFKALFSRPEFNVMDGLDIYIDDYNKFTPLSQEDIGKMTLSKQLLSRPDLELPTITDVQDGLDRAAVTLTESEAASPVVFEKSDASEQLESENEQASDHVRVIPDDSQVIVSNDDSENSLFETPDKK